MHSAPRLDRSTGSDSPNTCFSNKKKIDAGPGGWPALQSGAHGMCPGPIDQDTPGLYIEYLSYVCFSAVSSDQLEACVLVVEVGSKR